MVHVEINGQHFMWTDVVEGDRVVTHAVHPLQTDKKMVDWSILFVLIVVVGLVMGEAARAAVVEVVVELAAAVAVFVMVVVMVVAVLVEAIGVLESSSSSL